MTPPAAGPADADLALWGREALEVEGRALAKASTRLGESFARAVRAMLEAQGKVIVTGLGKSGHIARKLASTLSSTGTSALYLHPTEGLHGDFGMIQTTDCLVAIAFGGETNEVLEVSRYARRVGIPVIAITGKLESTLARLAHVVIDGSIDREADPLGLAPTCSSTVALALGDAMAVSLMRARGFTTNDFAALHPGGSLGRRLSLVKDHMHVGDRLPVVSEDTDFHEVLAAVTRQNFGIVAVTSGGRLLGAVSDGDLRRALMQSGGAALAMRAKDLMSKDPKTTFDTTLAIDALTFMSNRQITQLFVVTRESSKQLIGIVRLHDLLAAKIL